MLCPRCALKMALEVAEDDTSPPLAFFPELEFQGALGRGGFGHVFKAQHRRLRRPVALKLLDLLKARSAGTRELFTSEMAAAGRLDHPGIVHAYDAGERDGLWYIIMEFVDGLDCGALVRKHGMLPVAESCEIIRQAALALNYAHEIGLVHRDVKPGNMMVSRRTEATTPTAEGAAAPAVPSVVKVLDFGLAGLSIAPDFSQSAAAQGSPLLLGTLDYISPEQIQSPSTVDARADIYSLGATLWRLLTGKTPHGGPLREESLAVHLNRLATEPLPSVATVRPNLPGPLVQLCDSMLSLDRSKRPASAAQVARLIEPWCIGADLSRLFLDGQLEEKSPTFLQQINWIARRHKIASAAVLAFAIMLVTATIAGLLLAWQSQRSEAAIAVERDRARDSESLARVAEERTERESYQASIQLAQLRIEGGEPWLALESLYATKPSLRGWEWGYLRGALPKPEAAVETGLRDASQLAASWDGATAFAWDEFVGALLSVDGSASPIRLEMPGRIKSAALSEDGSLLALVFDPGALRVLRRDGSLAWEIPFTSQWSSVAWEPGPSGALLAVNGSLTAASGDLRRLDRTTGAVIFEMKLQRKPSGVGLAIGRQGRFAAIRTSFEDVTVITLPDCRIVDNFAIGSNALISDFVVDDTRNRLVMCAAATVGEAPLSGGHVRRVKSLEFPGKIDLCRRVSVDKTGRILASTDRFECYDDGPQAARPFRPTRDIAPVAGFRHLALLARGRVELRPDERSAALSQLPSRNFANGAESRRVAWSADSSMLVTEPWERTPLFIGAPDQTRFNMLPTGNTSRSLEWCLLSVWHPDGSLITHANDKPAVLRASPEAPRQPSKWPLVELPLPSPVWSATPLAGGSRVAFATPTGVSILDWKTLTVLREFTLPGAPFYLFTYSDDTTVFALGRDAQIHRITDQVTTLSLGLDESELRDLSPPAAWFQPRSLLAIGTAARTRMYRIATSEPFATLVQSFPEKGRISAVAFTPDGRRLVTADSHFRLILWDWEQSLPLLQLPIRARCSSASFSPDGRWLAVSDFAPALECREALPWLEK